MHMTNATPISTQLEPLQEHDQEALDTVDESVKLDQEHSRRNTAIDCHTKANDMMRGVMASVDGLNQTSEGIFSTDSPSDRNNNMQP